MAEYDILARAQRADSGRQPGRQERRKANEESKVDPQNLHELAKAIGLSAKFELGIRGIEDAIKSGSEDAGRDLDTILFYLNEVNQERWFQKDKHVREFRFGPDPRSHRGITPEEEKEMHEKILLILDKYMPKQESEK